MLAKRFFDLLWALLATSWEARGSAPRDWHTNTLTNREGGGERQRAHLILCLKSLVSLIVHHVDVVPEAVH